MRIISAMADDLGIRLINLVIGYNTLREAAFGYAIIDNAL